MQSKPDRIGVGTSRAISKSKIRHFNSKICAELSMRDFNGLHKNGGKTNHVVNSVEKKYWKNDGILDEFSPVIINMESDDESETDED